MLFTDYISTKLGGLIGIHVLFVWLNPRIFDTIIKRRQKYRFTAIPLYLISTLIAYIETYEFISCKVGHVEI